MALGIEGYERVEIKNIMGWPDMARSRRKGDKGVNIIAFLSNLTLLGRGSPFP